MTIQLACLRCFQSLLGCQCASQLAGAAAAGIHVLNIHFRRHLQADRKETLSAIGEDLFTLAVDQPFRFPAAFTFVLRAFTTLEGIGRSLDPEFQFSAVAQPYGAELLQLQVPLPLSP